MLPPLPYSHPEPLVMVWETWRNGVASKFADPKFNIKNWPVDSRNLTHWKEQNHVFESGMRAFQLPVPD